MTKISYVTTVPDKIWTGFL